MYAVIAEPVRDIHNWVSKADNQSIKLLPSRLLKQNHGRELGPQIWKNYAFSTKVRCISVRCNSCLRLKAPIVIGSSRKSLRLSAFKSNGQKDDSGSKSSSSKSLKKSVGLSYAPPESESMSMESLKAHSIPAYPSDTEPTSGSLAILNLFKSWLTLLHMPSSRQGGVGENLDEEEETLTEVSGGTRDLSRGNEKTRILKVAWGYFMGLNASVKIPMLIFIPSYLAVNLIYGSEVAKDLYPLWIIGPLIVALYIKIFHLILALYLYTFNQTIKILKNIPSFIQVSYTFVISGKLKDLLQRSLLQPLINIKDMDYKEWLIKMVERFNKWAAEKYIDYVESIWPFYCRTIRFLKRAHLL